MEITKQLPITVEIYEDEPKQCDPNCKYFCFGETDSDEQEYCCLYFEDLEKTINQLRTMPYGWLYERVDKCLEQFGQ